MRKIVLLAVVAVSALVVVSNTLAAKPGNSLNAKLCQKGGWENWVRADQTAFANEEDCVSYAAEGGTLTAPAPPVTFRSTCESLGGTYGFGGSMVGFSESVSDRCDWTAFPLISQWDAAILALWSFCPGYPDQNKLAANVRFGVEEPFVGAIGCRVFD